MAARSKQEKLPNFILQNIEKQIAPKKTMIDSFHLKMAYGSRAGPTCVSQKSRTFFGLLCSEGLPTNNQSLFILSWSSFQLSVESNFVIILVCLATLCYRSKKSPATFSTNRSKTNRDLSARVFPRLAPVTCICFEF